MYVTVCVCICFCTAGLVVIRTVIRNSKFEAWVQGARFVHFSRRPLLFFFFFFGQENGYDLRPVPNSLVTQQCCRSGSRRRNLCPRGRKEGDK